MNIIFDLGGVVLEWNPDSIIASSFGDPSVHDRVRSEVFAHEDWLELDRGALDREEAIRRFAVRTELGQDKIRALMDIVPRSLTPIQKTLDLIHDLRDAGHRLFCLSNMHVASIEYLEKQYSFWEVFDGLVISCRVGMIKPEHEIYLHLLERHGLQPHGCVFVDDMPANLEAADQLGIRTIAFGSPEQCQEELRSMVGVP